MSHAHAKAKQTTAKKKEQAAYTDAVSRTSSSELENREQNSLDSTLGRKEEKNKMTTTIMGRETYLLL
jgi:hypothetical protein